MSEFLTSVDQDNAAVRRALYDGQIILLPANQATRALVQAIRADMEAELAASDSFRQAQFHFTEEEFFAHVGRLRKRFFTSPQFHALAVEVMLSLDFAVASQAFDPIRLRVVAHDGHHNPSARPVYYAHRDTWYSHSQSILTWWIPLHDVRPEETFEFFPDEFARAVANDSESFDFDRWVKAGQQQRIGWQDPKTGRTAQYPKLLEEPRGRRLPVACRAGDLLLFSGQHLHQTRPNVTGLTRFSVDFRSVHLTDHVADIGAKNVDNRSTGSSLSQFIRAADFSMSAHNLLLAGRTEISSRAS